MLDKRNNRITYKIFSNALRRDTCIFNSNIKIYCQKVKIDTING